MAAPPGAGSIGLRLLDEPATAGNDPRARLYIIDHLAPGAIIHRRIEVSNTTTSVAHVALYVAAATVTGGSFLPATAQTPNDLSTWTSVRPGTVDVPAGGLATPTVTLTVPADASPGERYAAVWAEVRSAQPTSGGVVQVSRVGIRMYVSVGPGGAPDADFTIAALTSKRLPDGRPQVLATIRNTGGRALDMSGSLMLRSGPGGLSAGPFTATLGTTLAVGDTEPVTVTLDSQLPVGPWMVEITLKSGLLEHVASATLRFPATGTTTVVTTHSDVTLWIYIALGLLLLLVVVVLMWLVGRRRRRADQARRAAAELTQKASELVAAP